METLFSHFYDSKILFGQITAILKAIQSSGDIPNNGDGNKCFAEAMVRLLLKQYV